MVEMDQVPELDKANLVENIRNAFINYQQYKYKRILWEFFDDNKFLGDNLIETTFRIVDNHAPVVYEVSGPYDTVSNNYAAVAKVFYRANLVYQCNLKPGVLQRTAAMVWLYMNVLGHKPKRVLLYGAGQLALEIIKYLAHFARELESLTYSHYASRQPNFENAVSKLGIACGFAHIPDLGDYDTIIMATNTKDAIIHEENFNRVMPSSLIISLCTTSQTGEISDTIYSRPTTNIFFDHEETRLFTEDMRRVNAQGYLSSVHLLAEILDGQAEYELGSRINILRLTGTPMQNIAVIDMMLAANGIQLR